jgi:flagellar biosynthesis/type III secretory pathway protein FliH
VTFYLVHRDGKALVASDRPLLKAREADRLQDASALLARAEALENQSRQRRDGAEQDARQKGLAQGLEEGRSAFSGAIAELTAQVEAWRQTQEREVAALALAALRRMVDDIGEEAMMVGLARRAVAAVANGTEAQVHVAPALADVLAAAFAGNEALREVAICADPELAAHQCRVVTSQGRIIADLAVQLAEIEKRWNLAHVD